MKTTALIEKGKDGRFGIFTPDIEHTIIGDGDTVDQAKTDFFNSANEMIASYSEKGINLPPELANIEFEFKYGVASLFNYYNWINATKFGKIAGINPSLMRQYKAGISYISEKQVGKIEEALHNLANELAAIKLI